MERFLLGLQYPDIAIVPDILHQSGWGTKKKAQGVLTGWLAPLDTALGLLTGCLL